MEHVREKIVSRAIQSGHLVHRCYIFVVLILIVRFRRGRKSKRSDMGQTNMSLTSPLPVFSELHASYPTASAQHEKQRTGCHDCPGYANSRQTCALRQNSRCDARAYRTPLSERRRRHKDLWHAVLTRNGHTALRIRHNLRAGEDIHKRLVRREDRIDPPGYPLRALAPDVGEEREHRGFGDGHGMVLD
jgi:hypothetical protein